MNTIIKKYNLFVKKYHKIEKDSTEKEIHAKRVFLRRTFPILDLYKIKSSKIKNGEKAFDIFGKLRDLQVQILKLESIELAPEIREYLDYLRKNELKLQKEVRKFCKNRKLSFPSIKKTKVDKSKIYKKVEQSYYKLIGRVKSDKVSDTQYIHKIRIEFKKYRYLVEMLSYTEKIDKNKLEKVKIYQDKLGEIQDYEVLITGLTKFYKKREIEDLSSIEMFEKDQKNLIDTFYNEMQTFITVCRDVIHANQEVASLNIDNAISHNVPTSLSPDLK